MRTLSAVTLPSYEGKVEATAPRFAASLESVSMRISLSTGSMRIACSLPLQNTPWRKPLKEHSDSHDPCVLAKRHYFDGK